MNAASVLSNIAGTVPRVGWCKRDADCYRRNGC